jgi:predicted DNA-binding protein (MmcQ/YjbR family)
MGNLNFNNLFIGISKEQIIVLAILVVASALFGLMAGATLFYPLGYRRCKKDGKGSIIVSNAFDNAASSRDVPDTFDLEEIYDEMDLLNFVDDGPKTAPKVAPKAAPVAPVASVATAAPVTPAEAAAPVAPVTPVAPAAPVTPVAPVASVTPVEPVVKQRQAALFDDILIDDPVMVPTLLDITPGDGEEIEVEGEPLRDDAFVRMEANRKQQVPIITRSVLLNYCSRMCPLASDLPIRVVPQDDQYDFDRIMVKDYTFALVFEYKKILRLVLRLHANTISALRRAAGNTVSAELTYGNDWYSWVITDIANCEKVVAKVLDMSYKYVAHATYMRGKDNEFVAKVPSYERNMLATAEGYDPSDDVVYTALAGQMNAKYQLHYFGRKEAEEVVRSIKGKMRVSVEEANSSTSIFKAGGTMFAVVYESYGVVKLLFRADQEYVDQLHSEHLYVGCSIVPRSQYRQWYYAILDKSFEDAQCADILRTAYHHVSA